MPRRRRRTGSLTKAAELSILAPQVIALRSLRMNDRRELGRMGTEKVLAFWESMSAMGLQMAKAQQECALFAMRQWWSPWKIFDKALGPVHKRASANARRLGRRQGR
jgi:hypothetical protein